MKHVIEQIKETELIHFLHSPDYSFCGSRLADDAEFTDKKVNCGHCIALIERGRGVKRDEYV